MAYNDEKPRHAQGSFNPAISNARASTSRSSNSYGSYETGESSTAGSESLPARESDLGHTTRPELQAAERARVTGKEEGRRPSHRPRPTGGFLLADPVFDETQSRTRGDGRDDGRRRSRIPVDSRRAKSPMYSLSNKSDSSNTTSPGDGAVEEEALKAVGGRRHIAKTRASKPSRIPSPKPNKPADLDSTQIVGMALNLSESRRMAQRRHVSSPMPPRLSQVPDSPVGGSLKQHLQQQRRTSRNISPKPDRSNLVPRNISASHSRLTSPLQASFDPDSSYTYHFSSSTLNRAQKAKEHFELMAQYRRLLNLVPPLQYEGQTSRPSTSTPPMSPTISSSSSYPFSQVPLGRAYNPLQYIRNRKVRARERKAIDGEAQGFADVNRVTDWVDQAATMVAASPLQPGPPSIPPFPTAHAAGDPNIPIDSVSVSSVSKPKRPRIDWFIDPADMVADAYWVEQDDNKSLIEDRHYTRIFPLHEKAATTSRPMSLEIDESATTPFPAVSNLHRGAGSSEASADQYPSDSNTASKADTEASHITTRERARQKLHELRGVHHHNSSGHNHRDFLHLRKSSYSDTSDSEADRRKRDRSGTISANSKAILEKQMNEMLAREALAQEVGSHQAGADKPNPFRPTSMTPEKPPGPSILVESSSHTWKDARTENQEVERPNQGQIRQGSPVRTVRASLEVPGWNTRASMDLDTSAPPSPVLKASKNGGHRVPAIGIDLSPPGSRPESPVRNPFHKVKSIFRDRSRERANGPVVPGNHERLDSPLDETDQFDFSRVSTEGFGSPARRRSKSPAPRIPRTETHKSHKSMGSVRLGKDEQSGLRNMLKGGGKIDGIIREGVSKVSDLLWRRDQESGLSSETSSDESDIEPGRGRLRTSPVSKEQLLEAQHEKRYLDIMPPFNSASELEKSSSAEDDSRVVPLDHASSPTSRRSNRFDKLKPPRIDVLNASPTSSPIVEMKHREYRDTAVSDTESLSHETGVSNNEARKSSSHLNGILSLSVPSDRRRRGSAPRDRHWSISDRSPSPKPTTQLSRHEVARLRALALSSGIKAMEIARRAAEPKELSSIRDTKAILPIPWDELSPFITDKEEIPAAVSQLGVYKTTAQVLASSIDSSDAALEKTAHTFLTSDMRQLRSRVDGLHTRVATDLIDMTRRAADEADECSRDIADSQRLKVKRVVDIIDKMLRRRRRRFRWARRGGWLMVEWALVGFMWYVWFVVVILRIFLGIGRGAWNGVRWLLWL